MRVLFAGSPDAAVPTLQSLYNSSHQVVGVLTQPARPAGRKKLPHPTAVEHMARELGIPVFTPTSSGEIRDVVSVVNPDVAVVVAYGRILDEGTLACVPLGWWNVHFSLLPRWRGAAPVHHAVAAGDEVTGVTLFQIVPELDAGPIAAQTEIVVEPHDTEGLLLQRLAEVAPALVGDMLHKLQTGSVAVREQVGEPTFAPKLPVGAGRLDLRESLEDVYRAFRSFTPEPGAFLKRFDTEQVIKVIGAWPYPGDREVRMGAVVLDETGVLVGTKTQPLVLRQVKPAGKTEMDAEDWFRGLPLDTRMHVGPS